MSNLNAVKSRPVAGAPQHSGTRNWNPVRTTVKPHRRQHEVAQPSAKIKAAVAEALVHCFLRETPPAHAINVIPEALWLVDATRNIWIASVQTILFYKKISPRVHVSKIRFCAVAENKPEAANQKFAILHNHVIFL